MTSNENPIISIIIPVYKAEKYLRECLDSIVSQSFTDWECILIDDGSPDKSGDICDEYASKNTRFKVIHKKNEGVSKARNDGLKIARGKWISFVDSDDWIDKETYKYALNCLDREMYQNIDIIQWGIIFNKDFDTELETRSFSKGFFDVTKQNEYFEPSLCYKLVKHKLLEEYQILFPEGITLSEDRYFSFLCYYYSKKNYAIDKCFYHYRCNPNSSTHNMDEKNINDEIIVINKIENIIADKIEWQELLYLQKKIVKNHVLFLLKEPNFDLWRKVYPEINKRLINSKLHKGLVFILIILHFDVIVRPIIKIMRKKYFR